MIPRSCHLCPTPASRALHLGPILASSPLGHRYRSHRVPAGRRTLHVHPHCPSLRFTFAPSPSCNRCPSSFPCPPGGRCMCTRPRPINSRLRFPFPPHAGPGAVRTANWPGHGTHARPGSGFHTESSAIRRREYPLRTL
ncbi:hypothetical protein C8Q79DRAFT_697823 [Trametes meyenii]|nr:hypothetical protein C8Q79DRAFT_697823 [Trametes meyenii]